MQENENNYEPNPTAEWYFLNYDPDNEIYYEMMQEMSIILHLDITE